MDVFYRVRREDAAGADSSTALVTATESTEGPWDPRHQHAGPPSALLARAVQRLSGLPTGFITRATVEILSPVPISDLVVRARVLRPGVRVGLAEATMYPANGSRESDRPLLRMTAWVMREADPPVTVPPATPDPSPPPGAEVPPPPHWDCGYLNAVRWEWSSGRFDAPGPATVWTRMRVPLIDGEDPDGIQRVLVVADAGNGISAIADPAQLLFVNTDLTVHLHRRPDGQDIWLAAVTVLDPGGTGLATSRIGDSLGGAGVGAQSLFVAPRTQVRK